MDKFLFNLDNLAIESSRSDTPGISCLNEDVLWQIADSIADNELTNAHLEDCPYCQNELVKIVKIISNPSLDYVDHSHIKKRIVINALPSIQKMELAIVDQKVMPIFYPYEHSNNYRHSTHDSSFLHTFKHEKTDLMLEVFPDNNLNFRIYIETKVSKFKKTLQLFLYRHQQLARSAPLDGNQRKSLGDWGAGSYLIEIKDKNTIIWSLELILK